MNLSPVSFSRKQAPQQRHSQPYEPGRHSRRFWAPEEDDVLRQHYGTGLAPCAAKLPNREIGAIHQRARALKLKGPRGGSNRKHVHTPESDAKIREAWPNLAGRGALQAFAESLGIDRWVVSKRALTLGLTKAHKKEPNWTAAEDALMARVPLHAPRQAAAVFRQHGFTRTASAIIVHARRIGLSRRRSDVLSAGGAAKILGVDTKWVTARCIDGRLTATKRGTSRLVQQGGDTWSIRPQDLRQFIVDRIEEIDIRKVEKCAFVALLTEPSPEPLLEAAE